MLRWRLSTRQHVLEARTIHRRSSSPLVFWSFCPGLAPSATRQAAFGPRSLDLPFSVTRYPESPPRSPRPGLEPSRPRQSTPAATYIAAARRRAACLARAESRRRGRQAPESQGSLRYRGGQHSCYRTRRATNPTSARPSLRDQSSSARRQTPGSIGPRHDSMDVSEDASASTA